MVKLELLIDDAFQWYFYSMKINYNNRKFRAVQNSSEGQVNSETLFLYTQHGNLLKATYSGGKILDGNMIGAVSADNSLHFTYQHIDIDGQLKNGICNSTPELLPDGRIRLHEKWKWTYGGDGEGSSIVEEVDSE